MKVLRKMLFTTAIVVGIAMTASAQSGEKPPPKQGEQPKIKVPDEPKKPPPTPQPTPKRPRLALLIKSSDYLELV